MRTRRSISGRGLCHGELGMLPHLGWLETKHDIFVWHAMFEEVGGDSIFDPIFFDPNFVVTKHNVQGRLADPVAFCSPNFAQNVLTMLIIEGQRNFIGWFRRR